jgi:adenylate cyclase
MDAFASAFTARVSREETPLRGTRIGVCSGLVVVGHVGGKNRLDYRALGDAINTASRLEHANRYFGTRISVASETVARVPDFAGRRIGVLRLAGKRTPVEAWEPLHASAHALQWIDAYEDAYDQMARGEPAALENLRELAESHPGDPLVRFHRRRLEAGQRGAVVDLAAPTGAPLGEGAIS